MITAWISEQLNVMQVVCFVVLKGTSVVKHYLKASSSPTKLQNLCRLSCVYIPVCIHQFPPARYHCEF